MRRWCVSHQDFREWKWTSRKAAWKSASTLRSDEISFRLQPRRTVSKARKNTGTVISQQRWSEQKQNIPPLWCIHLQSLIKCLFLVGITCWDITFTAKLQERFKLAFKKKKKRKKNDISQARTWNPFSRNSTVSYWNVTRPDWLTALPLWKCCFIYERTRNHNLRRRLIKPSNVLIIIKGSHLAENDPAEEITGLGFLTNTVGFDCNWLFFFFLLCPGVTGE